MTTPTHMLSGRAEDKIWLGSYPARVPSRLGEPKEQSLAELVSRCCAAYSDRPAFESMGRVLTYRELDQVTRGIAAWLQQQGLAKGDRVAVMMPNILQNPAVVYGILRAGMVVVNVNPLYTPRELEHQLKDSGARAIFVLENFAHTVEQVLGETALTHVVVTRMGDMLGPKGLLVNLVVKHLKKMVPDWSIPGAIPFKRVLSEGNGRQMKPVQLTGADIAFLQYTGGTTGVSKGATLTHANLLANKEQLILWLEAVYERKKRPAQLNFLCALPLYHIFGLTVNSLMGISMGGCNLLIANPRDIPAVIKEWKKHRIHIFPGLNTLFNALMNNADFPSIDFSQMLLVLGGGMAVQRPVAERWQKITGCAITEGYGLSETSPVATANRLDRGEYTGTVGLPLPSTDIEIRDDMGQTLPVGEVGEICIRGPQVMLGYWQRPAETAQVISPDGFFRTGDIGVMDENGYTKIVDRKKDMILVSGFNVYPNEVEEVAMMHPGVLEAAAIGVPDEHSGEAVKLFVVRKDPTLTEEELRHHCAENLTGYKRPRHIEFRHELPKSNVGKILRKELRA